MTKIIVLGASGALGKHVAQQAVDAGHEVSVVVRTPSKLPASWRDKVKVHKADIATLSANQLGALLGSHDVAINTAGSVSDGDRFVTLVAHIVNGLETIEPANRPVAWFVAGAGLLDIGDTRRRGLELPLIKKTYWPHGENFKRLEASTLDFRLLCPRPDGGGRCCRPGKVARRHRPIACSNTRCSQVVARLAARADLCLSCARNDHPLR